MSRPEDRRPTHEPAHSFEANLRRQLEPSPAAVERVTRRALAERSIPRVPARRAWAMAALLGVVVSLVLLLSRPVPPPVEDAPSPESQVVVTSGYRIENAGGLVTVIDSRGQVLALVSGGSP